MAIVGHECLMLLRIELICSVLGSLNLLRSLHSLLLVEILDVLMVVPDWVYPRLLAPVELVHNVALRLSEFLSALTWSLPS